MSASYTGHCLCGGVHFTTKAAPKWVAYCHCHSCKRATGGIVAAYAGFAKEDVVFDKEQPQSFASSPGVTRSFCPRCGSPISYQSVRWADEIHLFIGTIDQADRLLPQAHVYTKEQLPWFHVDDPLPRYKTVPSEDEAGENEAGN